MNEFTNKQIGDFGEKQCKKYVKRKKGYKIIDTNVTIGHLEADIIATDKTHILIIEVKTRSEDKKNLRRPADAVGLDKKRNLINFVQMYCKTLPKKHQNKTPRIDVCEVYITADKKLKVSSINYIENAVFR